MGLAELVKDEVISDTASSANDVEEFKSLVVGRVQALVVEDNMIIAIDEEAYLKDLGFG